MTPTDELQKSLDSYYRALGLLPHVASYEIGEIGADGKAAITMRTTTEDASVTLLQYDTTIYVLTGAKPEASAEKNQLTLVFHTEPQRMAVALNGLSAKIAQSKTKDTARDGRS